MIVPQFRPTSSCALRGVALAVLIGVAPASLAGPTTILPLGDSITQGNGSTQSYRYPLWQNLVDGGYDFDFVGSLSGNYEGTPSYPTYQGESFDTDHEGHWGWETGWINGGAPSERQGDGRGSGNLNGWTNSYTADVALIHLGTNDLFREQSVSSTINEVRDTIDILRGDNSNVDILLAKLIPTSSTQDNAARTAARNAAIDDFNAEIDQLAAELNTSGSRVKVVDQHSGFNASSDTYDGIHPDASGEQKMADRWYEALLALNVLDPVDEPQEPEQPQEDEQPEQPQEEEQPEQPQEQEQPEQPQEEEQPEQPQEEEQPEQPQEEEQPEQPQEDEQPEQPQEEEQPEQPQEEEQPEQPQEEEQPEGEEAPPLVELTPNDPDEPEANPVEGGEGDFAGDDDSDTPQVIPTPAAAAMGVVMLGLAGLRRRR
jgi:MYXO-CTERM domain-containing protein